MHTALRAILFYNARMLMLTLPELRKLLEDNFPGAARAVVLTHLEPNYLELRLPFRDDMLRPGGTLSGPALMTLADTGAYYLILAHIGPVLLAVTTSLNINFMRKPIAEEVIATVHMLKLGRALAVVEVRMRNVSSDALVAQATVTYSIPPESRSAE